jgi:voltage-gated potassium channel
MVSMKKVNSNHIIINLRTFLVEIGRLVVSPVFVLLTVMGNTIIGIFSALFYLIESHQNQKIHSFMDALWWGFATATTTGYGDITPVTFYGKALGIFLMLTGTAIFAMFTALFAETILSSTKINKG